MTTIVRLDGCAPTPLAHYLKALAVLRLVAEQADPGARAFWRDDACALVGTLDEGALVDFFLTRYAPTPLVAPWNGGSGFYPKDAKDAFDGLAASDAARFAPYRAAIAAARQLVQGRVEAPKGRDKTALLDACRTTWSGPVLDWLDAAIVLTDDDPRYPALLGTGGNDGRLDFTNNQMQRLVSLFDAATGDPKPEAKSLLRASLFGETVRGMSNVAIGQFAPGNAGGANQGAGYSGSSRVNPWDFVLMLEGAIVFQVAAVRRLDSAEPPQAAAPFAFRGMAGGYASATPADETTRGEQWMPLWSGAATLAEVKALFAEGRMQLAKRPARTAVDAARAIARVGTSRGVDAYVRFGYLERNGQANLAVPIGRFRVDPRGRSEVGLLDEIDEWVGRLRRAARDPAPASIGRVVRAIESAMLAICQDGARPEAWQRLLTAMGDAEALLVARPRATAEDRLSPIPRLSPQWLAAADDDSAEMRLAAAIASQQQEARGASPSPNDRAHAIGPFRAHCATLDPDFGFRRFAVDGDGLRRDRRVVFTGRDLVGDLAAVALRRLVDAERVGKTGTKTFPLHGRAFARLDDVTAFLDGATDDAKISGWIRALAAIDWIDEEGGAAPRGGAHTGGRCSALHALFRLAYPTTTTIAGEPPVALRFRRDPAPLRLLVAGRLVDAADAALHGLQISGSRPKIRFGAGSADLARRLAASVAIPISDDDFGTLHRLLCKPSDAPPADEAAPSSSTPE